MSDLTDSSIYFYRPGPLDSFYKKQRELHWTPSEINTSEDAKAFPLLSEDFQKIIKNILMFFLLGDKVIIDNISTRLSTIMGTDDAERFFIIQASQELIHVETYENIARAIFSTAEEFNQLLKDCNDSESIKLKIGYGHKWITSPDIEPFERLISAACNEGIFFFTQFRIISEIRRLSGGMIGLDEANVFIRKDETLHRDANITMATIIVQRIADVRGRSYKDTLHDLQPRFEKVVRDATEVELLSIDDVFSGTSIKSINVDDMKLTAYNCANTIARLMGYSKIYDVEEQSDYADIEVGIDNKANIWERSAAYSADSSDLSGVTFDVSLRNVDF